MKMQLAALGLCAAFMATSAPADVVVRFVEGAPKDRFVIKNTGKCMLSRAVVTVDLDGSAGGLIFDVTGSGAGVNVFQPFEIVAGADVLTEMPEVRDGDRKVLLNIGELAQDAEVAFTIDVDDTIKAREITVTDAEIIGATVRIALKGETFSGPFSGDSIATVTLPGCDNA